MHVLAVIPARSGSKGIPHKNVKSVAGVPLLAHSIRHAKESKLVTRRDRSVGMIEPGRVQYWRRSRRIVVSTDSAEYADIAQQHGTPPCPCSLHVLRRTSPKGLPGAEAPFLRPAEISGDLSTDLECFQSDLCAPPLRCVSCGLQIPGYGCMALSSGRTDPHSDNTA
jgi:N-acylneuraminate cytidylyltransferase